MPGFLLALRLLVASVFAVAGIAKLADRQGARRAASDFGAPGWVGTLLPPAELAVAAALLPVESAPFAAAAAAALLALFAAAIGRAVLRGRRHDCRCFGKLHAGPAGPGAVGRNVALAGAAALVAAAGPGASLPRPDATETVLGLLALGLVGLGSFCWQLFRQNGRLLDRVRALEAPSTRRIGEPAPVVPEIPRGVPVLVVFTDRGCGACEELLPRLARLRLEWPGELEIALVERDEAAFAAYRVRALPSAVLVDADGLIASETVTGVAAIERLLATTFPIVHRDGAHLAALN
ncbi:MAG TPA: MauE/DoxX family redox-associated membrane protein [Gaiellaceae bacterium]|nr:MauE/DoxX family redox-associated membrane protein [Gaiellaceae bacterium]